MLQHRKAPLAATLTKLARSSRIAVDVNTALRKRLHGPPARGRIAMFHVGRCGSTVLGDMLDRHSQVRWGSELFHAPEGHTPGFRPTRAWTRSLIESNLYRHPAAFFGFETKNMHLGPHCIPMSLSDYLALLQELGFDRYIVLRRDNLLRVILSGLVTTRVGFTHAADKRPGLTRIALDPEAPIGKWAGSLVRLLGTYEQFYGELDALLPTSKLALCYEADIQHDPAVAYRKTCAWLGVEPEPCEVRLSRTNPFTIEQMLSNFDEIAGALRSTRYEWMLRA